uniref:GATA-type domain-containing protein n=1 Tax=Panagrolaimus davidi TaxID=227884 RepID=A0A914QWZ5_9BILA
MRKFVHQKYNYIPETSIIPFSTLPKCPIVTAVASTKKILEIPKSQNPCIPFSNIQNPNIFSPFKCDVVFYVNCLNPSLADFSNKLISSEEMVKTFKLPDGSKATICKMEYFMEENFGQYNLDMKDFELYKKFKSIKRFRICTRCGIKESDIWQMNFNGYYLCRRCLFYYKPSKPENSHIQSTEYSASEFFKILTINNLQNNQIPDLSIWENKQETFHQRQLVKYESDIFDIHEETFSDIVTIKDAEKLPTNIVIDFEMQPETNNDDEINDEWEIADKISETNSENDFVVA